MANTRPFITDRIRTKVRGLLDRTMDYTCDTKRASSTGDDGYTQPNETDWDSQPYHLTDQPCGLSPLMTSGATGEVQDRYRAMVLSRFKLEFPYGTDVLLVDRVYNLKDPDGNLVDPTALHYEATDIIPDEFSLSLAIESVH